MARPCPAILSRIYSHGGSSPKRTLLTPENERHVASGDRTRLVEIEALGARPRRRLAFPRTARFNLAASVRSEHEPGWRTGSQSFTLRACYSHAPSQQFRGSGNQREESPLEWRANGRKPCRIVFRFHKWEDLPMALSRIRIALRQAVRYTLTDDLRIRPISRWPW